MRNPVAGLLETGQQYKGRLYIAARLNFSNESLEWNTGVALFDLDKWRQEKLSEKCEWWAQAVNGVGGDQIAMNLALYGRIDTITNWRWNVRGFNIRRPPWMCLDEGRVLHWSGNANFTLKPWEIPFDPAQRYRWGYEQVEPYLVQFPCELNLTKAP